MELTSIPSRQEHPHEQYRTGAVKRVCDNVPYDALLCPSNIVAQRDMSCNISFDWDKVQESGGILSSAAWMVLLTR